MKAVFTIRGMPDAVPVHARKYGAEFSKVWNRHRHINKGAEIEMTF